MVPNQREVRQESHWRDPGLTPNCQDEIEEESSYGSLPMLKEDNVLRIGFQNVGGLPAVRGKAKYDFLRAGINKFDFDIFGAAEVNIDWTWVKEEGSLQIQVLVGAQSYDTSLYEIPTQIHKAIWRSGNVDPAEISPQNSGERQ